MTTMVNGTSTTSRSPPFVLHMNLGLVSWPCPNLGVSVELQSDGSPVAKSPYATSCGMSNYLVPRCLSRASEIQAIIIRFDFTWSPWHFSAQQGLVTRCDWIRLSRFTRLDASNSSGAVRSTRPKSKSVAKRFESATLMRKVDTPNKAISLWSLWGNCDDDNEPSVPRYWYVTRAPQRITFSWHRGANGIFFLVLEERVVNRVER